MEFVAEFWTEIDQASRRRSIRRAIGALAITLVALGGTIAGSSAGYYEVAQGAVALLPAV